MTTFRSARLAAAFLLLTSSTLLAALPSGCIAVAVGECEADGDCGAGEGCVAGSCERRCGNGANDAGEECDDGPQNGPTARCSESCTKASCGDAIVQDGEECDDGEANGATARCSGSCRRFTASDCGDGTVQEGEECDLGAVLNLDPYAGCSADCTANPCGNGQLDGEEPCDDGLANGQTGSTCSIVCTLPACGNARVDAGESCDDGNLAAGDGCSTDCRHEGCRARAIWAGVSQNFVLREDGVVVAWGNGDRGAIGLAPNQPPAVGTIFSTPAPVPFAADPRSIDAGLRFMVALDGAGQLRTSGDNESGTLGDGTLVGSYAADVGRRGPYLLPDPPGPFLTVTAGWVFVVALAVDGSLWGWGVGDGGPLGLVPDPLEPPYQDCRDSLACSPSPLPIALAGAGWRQIDAGGAHVVGLRTDFGVRVWGAASAGQLGRRGVPLDTCAEIDGWRWPAAGRADPSPVAIPEITRARAVYAGFRSTFVLDERGELWGVGSNCRGELGLPARETVGEAFRIQLPGAATATSWEQRQVIRVSSGPSGPSNGAGASGHTLLLNAAGELFGAGAAASGQLGSRVEWAGSLPEVAGWGRIPLPEGTRVVDAVAGNQHTLLLTGDGRVLTFGSSYGGTLGDGQSLRGDSNPEPYEVNLCP